MLRDSTEGDNEARRVHSLRAASDRNETLLVARVAAGDMAAFEALYRLYYPRLTRFLSRITHRGALVEELVNDTMLVVWHQGARYNGASLVSTWIFAIAYRKALKALSQLDEAVPDDAADSRPSTEPGPEQSLGREQLRARLVQALRTLSPEQRAVMALAYFHGAGCREIADIVECPVDTVKTRLFHARRRVRALFEGPLEDWL
jgi:RNA polymerase sigma-70 factor (ECF subfamily)